MVSKKRNIKLLKSRQLWKLKMSLVEAQEVFSSPAGRTIHPSSTQKKKKSAEKIIFLPCGQVKFHKVTVENNPELAKWKREEII